MPTSIKRSPPRLPKASSSRLICRSRGTLIRPIIRRRPIPFPEAYGDGGEDYFDQDYRTEHSKYFNDHDGFDNWVEDGHEQSAIDNADIPSFDTWYEREYGHSPDKYGSGGDGDYSDASVEFVFSGSQGSHITRTFSMKDGELHVHHDYFTAGATGDGLAKQLYQGSLPIYDEIGVQSISTLADIDVGSYAWARFGFQPDSPRSVSRSVTERAERMFKNNGLFDEGDWTSFQKLVDPSDGSFMWDVVDAKYYTTPEKAKAFINQIGPQYTSDPVAGRKAFEDASKGIVSVGRLLMVDSNISWNGTLDLHDEESVKRLEGYVGVWRASRAGLRSEPTPTPPSGPRLTPAQTQAKIDARASKVVRTERAQVVNRVLSRYQKDPATRLGQDSADRVWQAAVNGGMAFSDAVKQERARMAKVAAKATKRDQARRQRALYGPTPQEVHDFRRPIGPVLKAGRQRAGPKTAKYQDYNIRSLSANELARRKAQGY